MKKKLLKGIYLMGWSLLGLGLTAIMTPKECSNEEARYLEQFQYITKQSGYQKPKKGEVTFYQTNGPVSGGSVSALFMDEEKTVFAGVFGDGIYRKKSGEDKWEAAKSGVRDPFILSLMSSKEGVLFAGTIRGGVFRSEDKGKTWIESNHGLTNFEVATITEFQKNIFIGTGAGIFKSNDQGKQWEPVNKGMESILVRAILFDQSGVLFAGTAGHGIFHSRDMGKTWQVIDFKLQGEAGLNENYIRVMVKSPKNHLFAGTFGGGIFKSIDGGKRWIAFNNGLSNLSIRSIQVARDGTLYAGTGEGIFKSSNDGQSWISINGDLTEKSVQSMFLNPDHELYVGTSNGVFSKNNNESRWLALERGMTFPAVQSILGNPEKGFYAATQGGGIYRSRDGGNSWYQMNEGFSDFNIQSIQEDATHALYALAGDGVFSGSQLKKMWIPMDQGIGKSGIHALFIDPTGILFAGTEKGLFRRDNGTNYWEKVPLPEDVPIKWIVGDGQRLFALSGQEFFKIPKAESVLQPLNYPGHTSEIRGAYFKENLYLWSEREVFEGIILDHDIRWRALTGLPGGVNCQTLAVGTVDGNKVIFAGTEKGIFWSNDQGNTWNRASGKGLSADTRSFFSPYPGALLAGTADTGVLVGIGL
ncbi:MAG: YCF48-related protein [Nitrospiria bacterium]